MNISGLMEAHTNMLRMERDVWRWIMLAATYVLVPYPFLTQSWIRAFDYHSPLPCNVAASPILSRATTVQVYMQPSGLLSINGAAATTPFLKRLLDRFNVKAHLFRREGYKNAINQFTHSGYSAEHREATEAIVNGFVDQITGGVAESRRLTQQQALGSSPPLQSATTDKSLSINVWQGNQRV